LASVSRSITPIPTLHTAIQTTTDTLITDTLITVIRLTDIIQAHITVITIMDHIRTGHIEGELIIKDMAHIRTEHTEGVLIIKDIPLAPAGTAVVDITGDDKVFAMRQ
jgi:hypothetical protein